MLEVGREEIFMSQFAALLSSYMKTKNIRIYSLAQYCSMDRANMYKVINGKRNPTSEQMVHMIADYMRLTYTERRELLQAYHIALVGYDTYFRRENVRKLMETFTDRARSGLHASMFDAQFQHLTEQEPVFISNQKELVRVIHGILALESVSNKSIKLLLQPTCRDIMESLSYIAAKQKALSIEHIFCINNTTEVDLQRKDSNLYNLQYIIPLYQFGDCQYTPYCYYDSIMSHGTIFNLFQSLVLSSRYALVFSEELEKGILFTQPDVVEQFQELFLTLKKETSPIIHKLDSIKKELSWITQLDFGKTKGYAFHRQPCFIPLLPPSFPEKYLKRGLPDREQLIRSILAYMQNEHDHGRPDTTKYIFTEEGVRDFLKTGRLFELPDDVYLPVESGDRALLIRNLIAACKSGHYRMLQKQAPIAESRLCVHVTSHNGYIMFQTVQQQLLCLTLEEPGIIQAFYDYLSSLGDSDFYTVEEAVGLLKKMV